MNAGIVSSSKFFFWGTSEERFNCLCSFAWERIESVSITKFDGKQLLHELSVLYQCPFELCSKKLMVKEKIPPRTREKRWWWTCDTSDGMQCRCAIEEFIFTPLRVQNKTTDTGDSKKGEKRGCHWQDRRFHFIRSRRITQVEQTTPTFTNKVLNPKVEVSSNITTPEEKGFNGRTGYFAVVHEMGSLEDILVLVCEACQCWPRLQCPLQLWDLC